jgi:hypothetical protein
MSRHPSAPLVKIVGIEEVFDEHTSMVQQWHKTLLFAFKILNGMSLNLLIVIIVCSCDFQLIFLFHCTDTGLKEPAVGVFWVTDGIER